jgi:hypothetical protein
VDVVNALIAIAALVVLLLLAVVVDMTLENWGRLVTGRRQRAEPPTRVAHGNAFTTDASTRPVARRRARPAAPSSGTGPTRQG